MLDNKIYLQIIVLKWLNFIAGNFYPVAPDSNPARSCSKRSQLGAIVLAITPDN